MKKSPALTMGETKMKQNLFKIPLLTLILLMVSLACQTLVPSFEVDLDVTPTEYEIEPDEDIPQVVVDPSTLPDLTITGWASMPITGSCMKEYLPLESKVCVRNKGGVPAKRFTIETGENVVWTVDTLGVDENICFETEDDLSGGLVVVDPDDEVEESDERNNELMIPVPTPPVLCTPEI